MRKFILITAMVLVSATAHAGSQRSLTLASSDEPAKSTETNPTAANPTEAKPAEAEVTPAEASKYVERPSVVDTKVTPQAPQCQPAATTAEAPKTTPKEIATTDKPKHRHPSTESRVISELHRHGIYW